MASTAPVKSNPRARCRGSRSRRSARRRSPSDRHRHVDEEDPLPAGAVDQHAAGDDAERAADAGQRAPDAERDVALTAGGERHRAAARARRARAARRRRPGSRARRSASPRSRRTRRRAKRRRTARGRPGTAGGGRAGRWRARRAGAGRRRRACSALTTHWRPSAENPRSVWIAGRATFTIVTSRTTMNCATASTARASHLLRTRESFIILNGHGRDRTPRSVNDSSHE